MSLVVLTSIHYNLTFLSKVLKLAVCSQLMKHFATHRLLDQHQSAYRPGHCVETVFQHVYSSVSQQLECGPAVFLVLIDLSAAFDMVCHENLISLLASKFIFGGNILQCLQSYL